MPENANVMTDAEFRTVGVAFYGGARGWQTAMAARLGVAPRTVRRWASGTSRIAPEIAAALAPALDGHPSAPQDEWITGEGQPCAGGFRREYVVHARSPRFIARAVQVDAEAGVMPDEAPADALSGLVFSASDDTDLCEIAWIDLPPIDETELRELLSAAAPALYA